MVRAVGKNKLEDDVVVGAYCIRLKQVVSHDRKKAKGNPQKQCHLCNVCHF